MSGPVPVVHVITRLDVGGAQETAVRICAGLDRDQFRPTIVCGADAGSGGSLRVEAEEAGIEVVALPSLRGPIRPWADAAAVRDLRRLFRERSAAVVHTHSSKAGIVGRTAATRAGIPSIVHTVHGWSFNEHQPWPVAQAYIGLERLAARSTTALVVVARRDRDLGLEHRIGVPDRYALIRSGIAEGAGAVVARERTREARGWSDDVPVVISVGRLEAQKDPIALVEAFADLVAQRPARLVLVGEGGLRPAVEAAVAARGIAGSVELAGLRSDVPDLLAAADLYVQSSRFEGLPRSVLEAVRAGLPVVATDTGGVREIIEDPATGWLVPVGDRRALAAAMAGALADPDDASRRTAAAAGRLPTFTEGAMVAATEELYASLLGGREVPPSLRIHDPMVEAR